MAIKNSPRNQRTLFELKENICMVQLKILKPKTYLGCSKISMMEFLGKTSSGLVAVNYFCEKAQLYIFDQVLHVSLLKRYGQNIDFDQLATVPIQ